MSRADWIEAAGFLSMCAMVLGAACAFLIDGMEPAAFVGTLPGIAFVVACHFFDWERDV